MSKNEETIDALVGCVSVLILFFVVVPIAYILDGWVLTLRGRWFVVPVFGAPQLSLPFAIGLALIVGFLTRQSTYTKEKDTKERLESFYRSLGNLFISPFVSLLIAYVVYLFT